MNSNQIKIIEIDSFSSLLSLKYLNLSNNNLTKIRNGTFNGPLILASVNFESNKIELIETDSFSSLLFLKKLIFNYNNLKKITNGIFNGLQKLTELK